MTRARKRSTVVGLVLIGAVGAGLGGCSEKVQRNRYASLQDCVSDYTNTQCAEDVPIDSDRSGGGYGGGRYYYGPWYRGDPDERARHADDPGPGRRLSALRSSNGLASTGGPTTLEFGRRGGFGSTGSVRGASS